MLLKVYEPPHPLRTFVHSIIYYEGYNGLGAYETLLPDGFSQLIIPLDEQDRFALPIGGDELALRRAWIAGVQTGPLRYRSEQNATTLCIRFEPGGLHCLLGIPASEFRDHIVEAALVSRNLVEPLRDTLCTVRYRGEVVGAADTWKNILAVAVRTLRSRIMGGGGGAGRMPSVIRALQGGVTALSDIAQRAGYSRKHLIHIFKTHVGISPKKYQRVQRFNIALSLIHGRNHPDLADIAYQCGYYDQAHFTNDFRRLAGYSPTQYLDYVGEYRNVFSTDEIG
ncbi:MAG: helix-turn-helix transcriptional regulator [Spirochaetales bacterium]|nr:helix-turn-helix transcriptional regulator [Spirochaetales bacterium]